MQTSGAGKVAASDITALLLPVARKQLLVPNVTLAEVVAMPRLSPLEDCPNWILGTVSWRAQELPLISFEGINDEPFAAQRPAMQMAVFNATVNVAKMPFFGLALQASPRLHRVFPDDITQRSDALLGSAETMAVTMGGVEAVIPNLVYIEEQILANF